MPDAEKVAASKLYRLYIREKCAMGVLKDFVLYIFDQILSVSVFDIIDIAIVSVVFYYVFKFVRDRRAGKLAIGIFFIIALLLLSEVLNMHALNFILQNIVQVGIIGLVIVFQSELRTFLEKVGGNSVISSLNNRKSHDIRVAMSCIDNVVQSCIFFSGEKTGALIVFERSTKIGDVIHTGTEINADPSAFLIKNIFFNKAPLHDGALVIRDFRLCSAGCFLPLTQNDKIIKDLGTRHRAAIGMSENSDAVVVVVSEETGTISIAVNGELTRGFNETTLKSELTKYLIGDDTKTDKKRSRRK